MSNASIEKTETPPPEIEPNEKMIEPVDLKTNLNRYKHLDTFTPREKGEVRVK